MKPARPCVLTIAGSDSGAGAGVQADSRVIQTMGGFALTAITAVTAQNTVGVSAWSAVAPELLGQQVAAVLSDFPVCAVKTGLLPSRAAIEAVQRALARTQAALVVDPLLGSSSGTGFLDADGALALSELLFPRAALVTPNLPELEAFTGLRLRRPADVSRAAEAFLGFGCRAVLVKGGHGKGGLLKDVLVTTDGTRAEWASLRINTVNTHGTGCVLSAAIATGLARGRGVVQAIEEARRFLQLALEQGRGARWGEGRGPAFAGW